MSDHSFKVFFQDTANKVFTGKVNVVVNAYNNIGYYTVFQKDTNITVKLTVNNFKLFWRYYFPEVFDISLLPNIAKEIVEFRSIVEDKFYKKISVIVHDDAEKIFFGLQKLIIKINDQKFNNIYAVFINSARDKITINQTNEGDTFVAALRLRHKDSTEIYGLAQTILAAISAYENTFK